jgi:hypothetical protein
MQREPDHRFPEEGITDMSPSSLPRWTRRQLSPILLSFHLLLFGAAPLAAESETRTSERGSAEPRAGGVSRPGGEEMPPGGIDKDTGEEPPPTETGKDKGEKPRAAEADKDKGEKTPLTETDKYKSGESRTIEPDGSGSPRAYDEVQVVGKKPEVETACRLCAGHRMPPSR